MQKEVFLTKRLTYPLLGTFLPVQKQSQIAKFSHLKEIPGQAFSINRNGIYMRPGNVALFWKTEHLVEFYPTLITVHPERIIQNFKSFFYTKYIQTDVAHFPSPVSLKIIFYFSISTDISQSFSCNK